MSVKTKVKILSLCQLLFAIGFAVFDFPKILTYLLLITWAVILIIYIKVLKQYKQEERN